jgi:hypothetical protein
MLVRFKVQLLVQEGTKPSYNIAMDYKTAIDPVHTLTVSEIAADVVARFAGILRRNENNWAAAALPQHNQRVCDYCRKRPVDEDLGDKCSFCWEMGPPCPGVVVPRTATEIAAMQAAADARVRQMADAWTAQFTGQFAGKCECGAQAAGSRYHSEWCPKHAAL